MYPGYNPRRGRDEVPYYVQNPEFLDFVVRDVAATFRDGVDSAAVIAFNEHGYAWDGSQAKRAAKAGDAPFASYSVGSRADLRARLASLPPPAYDAAIAGFPTPVSGANDCSRPGAAANCSKMLEGLSAAKAMLSAESGEGIIWLVTDNIYEGGDAASMGLATAELDENRRFYESIRDDDSFRVVVAYPVLQGSGGSWLKNTSLFVYGIYFDADATRATPVTEVRRLLGDGAPGVLSSAAHVAAMKAYSVPSNPSPGSPFRLKPLNQDVVRISLASDVEQVRKRQSMGEPVALKAVMRIENLLPHRIVDAVRFRVENDVWAGWEPAEGEKSGEALSAIVPACPGSFETQEVSLTQPIGPGESATVEVPLTMPPVDYRLGSPSDVFQIGLNEYVVMGGALQAELLELKSHLAISPDAFRGTYGADSLPDVFRNPDVRNYTAQFVGRTRKIENPGTVLALGVLGGSALAGLGLGAGAFLMRSVGRRLRIDGNDMGAISVSRLRATPIKAGGREVARARLSASGDVTVSGTSGYLAKRTTGGWQLSKSGEPTINVELRTRK
jgi:hypothetical protein